MIRTDAHNTGQGIAYDGETVRTLIQRLEAQTDMRQYNLI